MSLFINEKDYCVDEIKQYVNLSNYCIETINADIRSFSIFANEESFSGFLNKIFYNFYTTSKASIYNKLLSKEEELNTFFNSKQYKNIDTNIINKIKQGLINKYKEDLIKENLSYPKGNGYTFRVNKQNTNILKELDDDISLAESLSMFLKIIFEEYALLPQSERIRIYSKDIIEVVEDAINTNKGIKITQFPTERFKKNTSDKETTFDEREKIIEKKQFHVKPYKIVTDEAYQYLYIIGLARPSNSNDEFTLHTFRISLIERVNKLTSLNGFICKEEKNKIDKTLITSGPQNMIDIDDPTKFLDIKVTFTNYGIEMFKRISYGRPKSFTKLDKNTYLFKADFYQARNYFWRFANNVTILEPQSLADSIKKMAIYTEKNYSIEK